jgi:hypothetical protein
MVDCFLIISGALLLMAACADATSTASGNDVSYGTVHVIYTRIYVSDGPSGLCPARTSWEDTDPESSIRYYFSFSPKGKDAGESIEVDYSEKRVALDPCTYRAEVPVTLEPGTEYEVCIYSYYQDSFEGVGNGSCGIEATTEVLADGRIEITNDDRYTGSPNYSTVT